ncbi:MAG: CBS domain-containing protein [Gemmatimonadota bacterium]
MRDDPETVRDIMSTALHTVAEDDPLELAARIMDRHLIRQVLVTDEDGGLAGVVSYRAILRILTSHDAGALEPGLPVRSLMDRDLTTFDPGTSLRTAVRRMIDEGLSSVPVVDEGRLVGVISEHDVVDVTARLLEQVTDVDGC